MREIWFLSLFDHFALLKQLSLLFLGGIVHLNLKKLITLLQLFELELVRGLNEVPLRHNRGVLSRWMFESLSLGQLVQRGQSPSEGDQKWAMWQCGDGGILLRREILIQRPCFLHKHAVQAGEWGSKTGSVSVFWKKVSPGTKTSLELHAHHWCLPTVFLHESMLYGLRTKKVSSDKCNKNPNPASSSIYLSFR